MLRKNDVNLQFLKPHQIKKHNFPKGFFILVGKGL